MPEILRLKAALRQQFPLTPAIDGAFEGTFRRGAVLLHAGKLRSHQRNRRINYLFVDRVRIIGTDEGGSERGECLRIRLALPEFCFTSKPSCKAACCFIGLMPGGCREAPVGVLD